MAEPDTMQINKVEYVRKDSIKKQDIEGNLCIVVLPNGFVLIGLLTITKEDCYLRSAYIVGRYGTTKGLGQLAKEGPTSTTKLYKTHGIVRFSANTIIFTLACEVLKWSKYI